MRKLIAICIGTGVFFGLAFLCAGFFRALGRQAVEEAKAPAVSRPAQEEFSYEQASVCVNEFCFSVQIADTPQKQSLGLMDREGLAAGRGMLFLYRQPDRYQFWMKNMRFPLDIIWISRDKKVVEVMRNVPPCLPQEPCGSFMPEKPVQYVLEVAAGQIEPNDIQTGDTVTIPFELQ